jgi:hypothetical protein
MGESAGAITHRERHYSGLETATLRTREDGPGFQPSGWCGMGTQGVALGWYGAGALPLVRGRK